jgi:hypothetical protein
VKSYVAIFICTTVKAVHLELVSNLSSDAFMAALQRFYYLYSDIGTTFVGVHHELRELTKLSASEAHQSNRLEFVNSETLTWHFTPPHSPQFGGLLQSFVAK